MISLKKRSALASSLFICAAFTVLFFSLNVASKKIFDNFVAGVIAEKNQEIVRAVSEQYRPLQQQFDAAALESVGMIFMHDGFIIDVEDGNGERVWDARDMDMEHCVAVLQKISGRMNVKHGKKSELQNISFPLYSGMQLAGNVNIASVGPLFYTEAQSEFITHLNAILGAFFLAALVFCVVVSVLYAGLLARPVIAATEAARKIAAYYAKNAQNALNDQLEIALPENYQTREFAALSGAINTMARELQDAQQRQKQLAGDVAHELRTPLTSIQGTIEAFLDGVWEASPERLHALLGEVKRLAKLVEDLQVLSSLESGSIAIEKTEFDLAELLQSAVEQFQSAFLEKGIEIVTQLIPIHVHADYDRTKQIMINILSNAIKYTDAGTITVSMEKISGIGKEAALIKIADTGRGISDADLPHIFDRFYRAEKSRNRGTGGAGVGLAIARALCAAQGWEIGAESREGEGSIFTVKV